jgi:thioredoxin 1
MSMNQLLIGILIVAVLLGGGYFLFNSAGTSVIDDSMIAEDTSTGSVSTGQLEKGTYELYAPEKLAFAESGVVVLHFHADWCPICRTLEEEILANPAGIPSGVHILKVEYDTATALKQKYGVTYQHTFVQVDAEGEQIAKWGDSMTLAQVIEKIQ